MNSTNTDEIFMEGLKEEFMEEMVTNLTKMAALLTENKFEEISRIAHDIKGTAGIFEFHEGTEIAKQLQFAAQYEEREKTRKLIDRLKEYMKKNGLDI